jgi:hypothetical protein
MEIKQAGQYELVEVLYLLRVCITELTSRGCLHWSVLTPQITEDIDKGNVFIIKTRNISVGTIILDPQKTYSNKNQVNNEKTDDNVLYINRLIIHPKWFSREIGNELVLFAEKYASDHKFQSVRFEVFAENTPVIDLFNSFQYKKAGEVHLPFQNIPFICLEKKIL